MKREERFVGNGNVWIANSRYRGWQVTCESCGVTKTITSHDGSSLPPDVIIKRFHQAGWEIGTKSIHDKCPGCLRRRRPSPIVNGNGHAAPVETPPKPALPVPAQWGGAEEYFQQLRVLAQHTLSAVKARQHNFAGYCAAEMIARLKLETTSAVIGSIAPQLSSTDLADVLEHAPAPKRRSKPAPAPIADPDYDNWLAGLETKGEEPHDEGAR